MDALLREYEEFLKDNKTERKVINAITAFAQEKNWEDIEGVETLQTGKTYC